MKRAIFALILLCLSALPTIAAENGKESAYERVMRTQVLRCGYINFDPWLIRDPNTGEMSGIFYDLTEIIAKKLGLKVEWVAESGFGTFTSDIQNNRFDALCSASWEMPSYDKHVKFAAPAFFMPVYAVVRAGDTRFDKNLGAINAPEVTIVSIDGDVPTFIRDEDFPQAKLSALPAVADGIQTLMEVGGGKADVTFFDLDTVQRFIASNPGKIKIVQTEFPVRLFPTSLVYRNDDPAFDNMISSALREAVYSGEVHKILKKYKTDPRTYIETSPPYKQ